LYIVYARTSQVIANFTTSIYYLIVFVFTEPVFNFPEKYNLFIFIHKLF